MKLLRLSKKIGQPKNLGNDCGLDISWASGPGFRGGSENYFGIKVEADGHNFALEFDVDESRRIKQQLDKFLLYIDNGKHRWEPGNYFKNLKKKSEQHSHSDSSSSDS
jgi:hypothetical protein